MSAVPIKRVDGVRVAHPVGDIDAANASQVERELVESLDPDGDCLVLDLHETRYLDSAALDMVFRLNERLRQRRGGLQVVIPDSSPLGRLAAIVGLPKVIPVHASVRDALARCSQDREARRDSEPPPLIGGIGEPDDSRHHCGR